MGAPRFYGYLLGFRGHGRLGSYWGLRYPYFHPEKGFYRHPQGGGFVYQVRFGVQVKYPYHAQQNPRWVNQMKWREIHSDGVIAAQALTAEERVPYAERAKGIKKGYWFNIFMSDWLHDRGPIIGLWMNQKWESKKWG